MDDVFFDEATYMKKSSEVKICFERRRVVCVQCVQYIKYKKRGVALSKFVN